MSNKQMEVEIAEWDFNLSTCNDPIPFITFVPSMDFIELAKRNNNEIWVTFAGLGLEEYDGKAFRGVVDISMINNPCKNDLSKSPSYYAMTFPEAPYIPEAKGGKFFINKPITLAPPTVLDPVENFDDCTVEAEPSQGCDDRMGAFDLALLGALIAVGLGIAILASKGEK